MLDSIIHGDCIEVLKYIDDNSIDSVVTDPPYGLGKVTDIAGLLTSWISGQDGHDYAQKHGFMNKDWDSLCPDPTVWAEVYRVMKPGAYLLVFAGTRTWDLMSMAIRLVGFENRDTIATEFGEVSCFSWVYGEGMPKSHNISLALDKYFKTERRDATYQAQKYDGYGTNLKPCWEPILVFRKPIAEKTIAENVLTYGTGGINIDGCRVPYRNEKDAQPKDYSTSKDIGTYQEECKEQGARIYTDGFSYLKNNFIAQTHPKGRWPSNFVLAHSDTCTEEECSNGCPATQLEAQNTTTSRYFNQFYYEPKAKKKERDAGCDELEEKQGFDKNTSKIIQRTQPGTNKKEEYKYVPSQRKNSHPTVKPLAIFRWLQRLITPLDGITLDPFAGSGSSCVSAIQENIHFIAIEKEAEYIPIAKARIQHAFLKKKEEAYDLNQ